MSTRELTPPCPPPTHRQLVIRETVLWEAARALDDDDPARAADEDKEDERLLRVEIEARISHVQFTWRMIGSTRAELAHEITELKATPTGATRPPAQGAATPSEVGGTVAPPEEQRATPPTPPQE